MDAQNNARKTASTLHLEYSIRCDIQAAPEKIWALLTDAKRLPDFGPAFEAYAADLKRATERGVQ